MEKKFTNHLVDETSPYLLQHAHNPVNWFPWGEAALQKAKEENKVILVSIGYSACHWCHVMERESFENETTAAVMNDHFINIKIDREERPDLDHIYMDAVQAMSGSGGWPLNVFLTPDTKPFFGGTYFPPVRAFNRSSWTEVLEGISQAWSERKDEIESQAENLVTHLRQSNNLGVPNISLPESMDQPLFNATHCETMFTAIMKTADKEWGGFGKAPKFPQTFTIQYLLQYYYFTRKDEAFQQALLSIDKMIQGGIYDHIGGGLARYSTDREWLAPHFEKMLYDNALLVNILCDAYQLTSEKKYEDAIRQTIGFIKNELLSSEGGFYAALDADSEGEEGKFYVWDRQEIVEVLGEDAPLFCKYFDVQEEGNWEGKSILRVLTPFDEFVEQEKLDKEVFAGMIKHSLQKLSSRRTTRIRPALDDKIILSWNALMLKSVAKAATVLQDDDYAILAAKNFEFLQRSFAQLVVPALFHTYKNGVAKYPAFLEDYAYLIAACIQLYQVNFRTEYLEAAKTYSNYVLEHFSDEEEIFFFFTHQDQQDVIVRKKEIYDGATPSGNAVMALNLQTLSVIFDNSVWAQRAEAMLTSLKDAIIKYPGSFGIWASLLLQKIPGSVEIAVTGANSLTIASGIQQNYIPNMVLMRSTGVNVRDADFPLLANRTNGVQDLIYLCKNYSCLAPFSGVPSLLAEINNTNKISI